MQRNTLRKTLLNRVHPVWGFVYEKEQMIETCGQPAGLRIDVPVRSRRSRRGHCSGCGHRGPTHDLDTRRFDFVPFPGGGRGRGRGGGRSVHCSGCGAACPGYDKRERRWQHLDTCPYRTIGGAELPRLKCSEHVVKRGPVPWAGPVPGAAGGHAADGPGVGDPRDGDVAVARPEPNVGDPSMGESRMGDWRVATRVRLGDPQPARAGPTRRPPGPASSSGDRPHGRARGDQRPSRVGQQPHPTRPTPGLRLPQHPAIATR